MNEQEEIMTELETDYSEAREFVNEQKEKFRKETEELEEKIASIICNKCGEEVSPHIGFTCSNFKCPIGSAAHTH